MVFRQFRGGIGSLVNKAKQRMAGVRISPRTIDGIPACYTRSRFR